MAKMPVRNGPPDTSKAWIAGWDASITFESNPYKRRDYARAFESGRLHGKRSSSNDVRILNLMLSRVARRRSRSTSPQHSRTGE
jgi:hypothetical protein